MDVSVGVPVHPAKEKPPINVVGDVGGRIAIMVVSFHNKINQIILLNEFCVALDYPFLCLCLYSLFQGRFNRRCRIICCRR